MENGYEEVVRAQLASWIEAFKYQNPDKKDVFEPKVNDGSSSKNSNIIFLDTNFKTTNDNEVEEIFRDIKNCVGNNVLLANMIKANLKVLEPIAARRKIQQVG